MTVLSESYGNSFPEQVAVLRLRLGNQLPTQAWDDLRHSEHDRAFVIAGAMKADLLADIGAAVDRAITEHRSLEKFREEFLATADQHGWRGWTGDTTEKGRAWRARVIYRTNMATSYAAGRMAQLVDGNFKFWVYKHGNALEPRLQHLAWDGVALPPDHPFWATHAPPNGWGCTCRIRGANTEAGIRRAKGDPNKALPDGWQDPDPKTGAPAGIDKGWDYAPGRSLTQTVTIAANKIETLPVKLGADYGSSVQNLIERQWPIWLRDTVANLSHQPGMAGVMSRDVIEALATRGITPVSPEIRVKPGVLLGPKADRHARAGDELTQEQWQNLPALLKAPHAVLIDKATNSLIFIVDGGDGQLAIRLNFEIKKPKSTINLIVSAYRPKPGAVQGRVVGGLLEILLGKLE